MLHHRTRLFLLLAYCISCCLCYFDDENYYVVPEDLVVIRPRRSFERTSFDAMKRSPISREKRVQMINYLINSMNDAERLRDQVCLTRFDPENIVWLHIIQTNSDAGQVKCNFLLTPASGIKKSRSMTSISSAVREQFKKRRETFRKNQCAGIVLLIFLGTFLNIFAYVVSVWSAQLQQEVVRTTVEKEHALKFRLKKTLSEAPSKYLIGLLNFSGRVASALGIVLLVQVVATYLKRRRYNAVVRSAAEEADTVISDMHGGLTDSVGECFFSFFQACS